MDRLNQLPCLVLITNDSGRVLDINNALLEFSGGQSKQWLQKPMENLLSPASRIFLQTHVWPMLLAQGKVVEIRLQLLEHDGNRVPVLVNAQKGVFEGMSCFYWVFFIAQERTRFEAELLIARQSAQEMAQTSAKHEQFIKTITNAIPGLLSYWDKNLCCKFANHAYLEWFGRSPEEMLGITLQELLGKQLFSKSESFIRGVLVGVRQQFERVMTKADGSIGYTMVNYIPENDERGCVTGFFVLASDVTPLKVAEGQLKLAASVFNSTNEGIMVTDIDGTIISVNPAFTKITGYSADEAIGNNPRLLKSNYHDPEFYSTVWHEIIANGHWEGETWNRRKDGEIFLVWQTISKISASADAPIRYVSVFNDITGLWDRNERTRYLAYHDALTDLPNRSSLIERLAQLIVLAGREPRTIAVMFLDLDNFKSVNDNLGHETGDELLQTVAKKIQGQVRSTDTVARLGGDEFVVLLDNPAGQNEVAKITAQIITQLEMPMEFWGKSTQIGTSIGIAMYPTDSERPNELIKLADKAMYAAKKAGKNTFRFFDSSVELN